MIEREFWAVVEGCRADSGGGFAEQVRLLHERLSALAPEEILSFSGHWYEANEKAFTWPVWDAACLLLGWVGDDSFMDFRGWLISHGRTVFERVVADPDSIADLADDRDNALSEDAEELGPIAGYEVYQEVAGQDPPRSQPQGRLDPTGERVDLKDELAVRARFPRLWELRRAEQEQRADR